jgi:hypothetical protein
LLNTGNYILNLKKKKKRDEIIPYIAPISLKLFALFFDDALKIHEPVSVNIKKLKNRVDIFSA